MDSEFKAECVQGSLTDSEFRTECVQGPHMNSKFRAECGQATHMEIEFRRYCFPMDNDVSTCDYFLANLGEPDFWSDSQSPL